MKFRTWIVATLVLGMALSASAATKTVKLYQDTTLNGTALSAGEYKVTVDDTGSVTFAQGKQVLARAQGKLVQSPVSAKGDTITTRGNGSGGTKIVKIQFYNSKSVLVLEEEETARN